MTHKISFYQEVDMNEDPVINIFVTGFKKTEAELKSLTRHITKMMNNKEVLACFDVPHEGNVIQSLAIQLGDFKLASILWTSDKPLSDDFLAEKSDIVS